MSFLDIITGKSNEKLASALRDTNEGLKRLSQNFCDQTTKADGRIRELAISLGEANERSNSLTQNLGIQAKKNNEQLQAIVKSLSERETPERLQAAIRSALQGSELHNAIVSTRGQLQAIEERLKNSGSRPIPVQTFPTIDDFAFEREKQHAAFEAGKWFVSIGQTFIEKLSKAQDPVDSRMEMFFSLVDRCEELRSTPEVLDQALKELMECSPKRVVAAFQKGSLEAGWTFVRSFNVLIDELAKQYPRCRAGIFTSRLNYSDVVQVSEEILAALRATSTMLDDIQRRHDLLESLMGEIRSDLDSDEISKIWEAIGNCFKDTIDGISKKDAPWWKKIVTVPVGAGVGAISWAMAVASLPQAQFQGQLSRAQRVRVFVATSVLLRHGWNEWSKMNKEVVIPNLRIMFALKCDYVYQRLISVADIVSANGYSVEQLPAQIGAVQLRCERNADPIDCPNR